MSGQAATLIGSCAVLLWSTAGLFTVLSGRIPPLQLVAMTFFIGGLFVLAIAAARGRLRRTLPTRASFLLGLVGLLGNSALFFAAIKTAPPAEANLVNYLWPLLIVLLAALLPGGRLMPRHLTGALLGLCASVLLLSDGGPDAGLGLGHGLAFAGALVWAGYSVLSRSLAAVPSESIALTMLGCAVPAIALHALVETTHWSPNAWEWLGVIGLGLGANGLAMACWDIGMKRGDVALLGVVSYAAPVLSTLALVAAGFATAGWTLALACLLIMSGALVANARGAGFRRRARPQSAG